MSGQKNVSQPLKFYGPSISTYSRIASLIAEEKGAPWDIIPTDPKSPAHRKNHPFGKAPALEWDGPDGTQVRLFESIAIGTFIDGTFGDAWALTPDDPLDRAQMQKWISVVDQYMFKVIDYEFVLPAIVTRMTGKQPDDNRARQALGPIAYMFDLVEAQLNETTWLAGDAVSLADFWMVALIDPLRLTPASRALIEERPALSRWFDVMRARPSFKATEPDIEAITASNN